MTFVERTQRAGSDHNCQPFAYLYHGKIVLRLGDAVVDPHVVDQAVREALR